MHKSAMKDLRRNINQYLMAEFGLDLDANERPASDSWPFQLRLIQETPTLTVFEFEDDEPYFVVAGTSLGFVPKAGMTVDDLLLQERGSSWIGARDPVDLNTSRLGDSAVPSMPERRRALEALGAHEISGGDLVIQEGLYLAADRIYFGLFRTVGSDQSVVAGLTAEPIAVSFPGASSWRRLAWGVGVWIQHEGSA